MHGYNTVEAWVYYARYIHLYGRTIMFTQRSSCNGRSQAENV